MNIDPTKQPILRTLKDQAIFRSSKPHSDKESVEWRSAERIEQLHGAQPDIRPEVVARGKELMEDPAYPPPEMVERIANFIGGHLSEDPSSEPQP